MPDESAYAVIPNRSIPKATVIPVLAYPEVADAVAWLCGAFGFAERLRIGDHRAQLVVGDEAVIVTKLRADAAPGSFATHSVLIRVEDVDAHHARAAAYGATILDPPTDYPYGERQYSVEDLGGHRWTFSQSVADVDPTEWGGNPDRPVVVTPGQDPRPLWPDSDAAVVIPVGRGAPW